MEVAISFIIIFTIIISSSVFIFYFGEFNFRTVVTKELELWECLLMKIEKNCKIIWKEIVKL